ncbi:MAG: peptidoglycan DD-metalloendopeptidase family protein [Saprospiraceae bacterium]|nr:peptidoglycan DD-metalloendopeptidase family protein [Saprospiraceae bacterium]
MNVRYAVSTQLEHLKSLIKPHVGTFFKASNSAFSFQKTLVFSPIWLGCIMRVKNAFDSKVDKFYNYNVKVVFPLLSDILARIKDDFDSYLTDITENKARIVNYFTSVVVPFIERLGVRTVAVIGHYVAKIPVPTIVVPPFVVAFFTQKSDELHAFIVTQKWLQNILNTKKGELKGAILCSSYLFVSVLAFSEKADQFAHYQQVTASMPKEQYGFDLSHFAMESDSIKRGDRVFSLLKNQGLTTKQADSLLTKVSESFDFKKIRIGKPYALFCRDTQQYLVVEPTPKSYFVFDVKTPSVTEVKRPIAVREFEIGGKLRKTLYSSLVSSGMNYNLIDMVQKALKDRFDFSKCEEGDEYKLIWEEELIDGHSVGINKLKSVYINGQCIEKPVYAFYYANNKKEGWYDKDSLPVRDGFLDSPVKNSVITSHFNLHRFHPILHYTRPHYGTDYAAPHGTPIIAVADGIVEEAKNGGGNGNYVKISHKNTYETTYLHMSRFAKGIEAGTPVKQKQVIGYVGSTGLATGPHVCFRFKKLGTPINHLTERIYSKKDSQTFKEMANMLKERLNKVAVLSDEEREKEKEKFLQLRKKR